MTGMETRMNKTSLSYCSRLDALGARRLRRWLGSGWWRDHHAGQRRQGHQRQCGASSSGAAVSKEAEANWKEATSAFKAADKAGWTAENCDSVAETFRDANKKQGGKFAEALYMQGLVADRCGKGEKRSAVQAGARDRLQVLRRSRGARPRAFKKGSEAQAFASFEQAVRDDPHCTEGYVNLAMMQWQRSGATARKRSTTCVARSRSMRSTCPRSTRWRCSTCGHAQDNKKMLDLAEVVCSQAQKIDANYAPIYNTWGLINLRKENVFDALRKFEKAPSSSIRRCSRLHELRADHDRLPRLRGRAQARSRRRSS